MRFPLRLPAQHRGYKWLAAATIASLAFLFALVLHRAPRVSIAIGRLDEVLYDSFYRLRKPVDRQAGPVVIVAVDDKSLRAIDQGYVNGNAYGWPWPRDFWGEIVTYLNACGARAVAFDVLFSERTVYSRDGDDDVFAEKIDAVKVPVVFATVVTEPQKPGPFVPPVRKPILSAANIDEDEEVIRIYNASVRGVDSIASSTVAAYTRQPFSPSSPQFRLHYYGPHQAKDGRRTFNYYSAANVIGAALKRPDTGVRPEMFRDKIVLIGAISAGTYDVKASPLSPQCPGVEIQATAIENLLNGHFVHLIPPASEGAFGLMVCVLAAGGVIRPRQVSIKLLAAILAVLVLFGVAIGMFTGRTIHWLPMATPLLGLILSIVGAFAYSYLTEDRQRRLIFRALSQAVSPEMAAEIGRNPAVLKLGGERREMTVMFTDVAGFTDLSEMMEVENLTALMNYYLEEMSSIVLDAKGYVDKYIGDSIMSFWNAPLNQPDHALRACRAALRIQRREQAMQAELRKLGAKNLLTRIGINSGPMAIGNMGSSLKFAYTVLGDSVNLASRLEGANKLYGSQILLAHSTAELVRDAFVVRQLDMLRVKGKNKPMAVYELMEEGTADAALQGRVKGYEAALGFYRTQRWGDAEALLKDVLKEFPHDAPVAALAARIAHLREDPPPADWDGVYVAKSK